MAKYGARASKTVESAMRRRKKRTLKSGSGRTVKSRKQAIAIGLNEARQKGAKVPGKKGAKTAKRKTAAKTATRKTAARKSAARKTSARKTGARRSTRKRSS